MRAAILIVVLSVCAPFAAAADLEILKTARFDVAVYPGGGGPPVATHLRPGVQRFEYSLQVTNRGPDAAAAVHIVDPLPPRVEFESLFVSPSVPCTTPPPGGQGTVTCDAASLASGQSVFITIAVRLRDDALSFTPVVNTATVTSATPDANLANNTSTVAVDVEANVPLSPEALLALALALGVAAMWTLRAKL